MPTPPKTSDEAIVSAARRILEAEGSHAFSLTDVSAAVGVRTPSLYKRFADRAALLAALEQRGFEELGEFVQRASREPDALRAMARAYRRFAHTSPQLYARMLAPDATVSGASLVWRQQAVAPVITVLTAQVGASRALAAARAVTAFLHGWVTMENTGAFRLGGDLEADFESALAAVLAGVHGMG